MMDVTTTLDVITPMLTVMIPMPVPLMVVMLQVDVPMKFWFVRILMNVMKPSVIITLAV